MKHFPNARVTTFDVETTGLWPGRGDRIIEIGALSIEGGSVTDEFSTLIHSDRAISREAQRIHGITRGMLEGKPLPEDVMPKFHEFIQDGTLIAHNALFDVAFIRHEFQRQGLDFDHQYLCTLEMSRDRFPDLPNYRLGTVYRHLLETGRIRRDMFRRPAGTETCRRKEKSHRALADARMVAAIWLAMEGK